MEKKTIDKKKRKVISVEINEEMQALLGRVWKNQGSSIQGGEKK